MYTISKDFTFSAAHHLTGLPDTHPCTRTHGHNYTVRLTLQTPTLTPPGFVLDYHHLAPIKNYIDHTLDHQDLNQALPHMNPTAENLAHHIATTARKLLDLPPHITLTAAVSETPKTWATWHE